MSLLPRTILLAWTSSTESFSCLWMPRTESFKLFLYSFLSVQSRFAMIPLVVSISSPLFSIPRPDRIMPFNRVSTANRAPFYIVLTPSIAIHRHRLILTQMQLQVPSIPTLQVRRMLFPWNRSMRCIWQTISEFLIDWRPRDGDMTAFSHSNSGVHVDTENEET